MIENNTIVLQQLFTPCEKSEDYLLPSTTLNYHSIQEICDFKKLSYQTIRDLMVEIKSYFHQNGVLPNNQHLYDLILNLNVTKLDALPKNFEVVNPNDISVTFEKIYGNDDLKKELMDIVNLFKFETNILNRGNQLLDKFDYSKGFILHGDAGVGKTLFAKAIAKQCELPFVSISGSAFQSRYVGDGKDLICNLFKILRQVAPVILFIDEIDSIGQRDSKSHSYSDENINQLLAEIDGVNTNQNNPILIIGATNHVDKLDSALIRPGRFDKIFSVKKPTIFNLKEIVVNIAKEYESSGLVNLTDEDYDYLTRTIYASDKGTGAFVANLFKLAHMKCKIDALNNDDENNSLKIDKSLLDLLIDELILGNEIKLNHSDKHVEIRKSMQKRTAYHEAGHAVVAYLLSGGNNDKKVRKVTVVPRNNALGITYIDADYDVYEKSQESLLNQICIAFAGACAESMFLENGKNTGASSDIEMATNIANLMVREYGLSVYDADLVGVMMNYNTMSIQLSDMIKNKLDLEVMTILRKERERCQTMIANEKNQKFIQLVAEKLIEKEVIFEEEIDEIAACLAIK